MPNRISHRIEDTLKRTVANCSPHRLSYRGKSMFPRERARDAKSTGKYIAIFLMGLAACSLSARPQSTYKPEKAPSWRYKVPASPTVDARTPSQVSADDQYFDTYFGAPDPLDGPQHMGAGMSAPGVFNEDFPARYRNEIVVAHFSTWSTYLTRSQHSVYTIVHLQIDRVVTDKDGKLKAGETIPLFVPGGTVRGPNTGKTISYLIRADDFPLEPNAEYLIFLGHPPQYPSYNYVKAWKVENGVLRPATSLDAYRASHGLSTHNGDSLEDAIHGLTSH